MRVYGLDTEDLDGEPTLYALDSRAGTDVWKAGPASRLELWSKLVRSEEDTAVFFLNLPYDLVNLLGKNLVNSVQPFCARRRIVGARIRGAGHIRFFELSRFLPKATLQEIGEMVGLPKLMLPFDDPRRVARDAKITRLAGERVIKELERLEIPLKYSPISGALNALEAETGGKIPVPNPFAVSYGKDALYGGRTEVYRTGHWTKDLGSLYYFDFSKAYGMAMLEELPDYSTCYQTRRPKERLHLADCSVEVEECLPGVAPLPFHPKGGGLIFPTGTFRGVWTNMDLDQPGVRVKKYHRCLNFPNSGAFLASLTRRILADKKALSPLAKAVRKNLYTGLSGKFSQGNEFTLFMHAEKAKPEDYWRGIPFGEWILTDRKGKPPRQSNYVWSTWIQSRNRIWHSKLFESIFTAGGKVLYGDTDSALAFLKHPKDAERIQYGQQLKTKMIPIATAELLSPKVYRMVAKDGRVLLSTKGVPSRLISAATVLGEETISGEIPDTFFQLLKGNFENKALTNRWRKRTWKFRSINRNRRVTVGNPWTKPLHCIAGKVQGTRLSRVA